MNTFQVGDRVRVIAAESWGHCRTPAYLQGKVGYIRQQQGQFRNPESVAYGRSGLPALPLYLVEFRQIDLWPAYQGATTDKLWADLYHHWLELFPESP
jgi:nitrile hydratase